MAWAYTLQELAEATGGTVVGAEGASSARFSAVSTDTRKIEAGQVFFALKGENFDAESFVADALKLGAEAAVCTVAEGPGPRVVVKDALQALKDFSAWHRARMSAHVIGITGSCGKTTTKDLIAVLLGSVYPTIKTQGNLNNDIGVPLSLLNIQPETRFAVIEMGANHVGEIRDLCALARPQESAVTLVAPAHLEGFGSIERIAQAKFEIAQGLGPGGVFYVNTDNAYTRAMGEQFSGDKVYFGTHGDVAIRNIAYDDAGEMLLELDPVGRLRLPLPVKAHAHNVALAVAIAMRHGITKFEAPLRTACAQAARFKVLQVGPLEVLDDTYNANPASMAAAIEALGLRPTHGKRIAALGEMLELGDEAEALHRGIGEATARAGASVVFSRGKYAEPLAEAARVAGVPRAEAIQDHADIARAIIEIAAPGDVLLLKGSRGMRMERVLEVLREHYAVTS